MKIKYLSYLLFLTSTIFAGCAGSPVHTSSMNRYQLMEIDDYTLCKAAAPREAYSPSSAVVMEVRRRVIDCQKIYVYTPSRPAQTNQVSIPMPRLGAVFLTSESYDNFANRLCRYGNGTVLNVGVNLCPLTID